MRYLLVLTALLFALPALADMPARPNASCLQQIRGAAARFVRTTKRFRDWDRFTHETRIRNILPVNYDWSFLLVEFGLPQEDDGETGFIYVDLDVRDLGRGNCQVLGVRQSDDG